MKSTLTVAGGPQDGQSLDVEDGAVCTLGSAPSASLQLPLANVAPQHVKLEMDPARGFVISDLGSATGTYVNGEKIAADHVLGDGDRVCLGPPGSKQSVKLVVRVGAAGTATPPDEPAIILDSGMDDAPAIILDDPGEPATQLAAAPPPPAEERKKAAKPEYTNDMPSIAAAPRESGPLPIPPPLPENLKLKGMAPSKKGGPPLPRLALAVGAGVLLSAILFFGWRMFSHKTPPVLTAVLPPKVEGGQTVSLSGTGFGSNAEALTVRFGKDAGKVISASDTQAAVTLPEIVPAGGSAQVQVTLESRSGRSNALFLTVAALPRITALAPDVAQLGDEVVASGRNLGGKPLSVLVAGQAAEVLDAQPQSLRFRVPAVPTVPGRPAPVVVQVGRESSKPANLFLGRLPLLIEVSPLRARAGERVTLRGRGFDASSSVSFEDAPALVFSAAESELVVAAPAAPIYASQFEATVFVDSRGSRSNPLTAILTRLSSGYFTPRYFPAPIVGHAGAAFVSTDIGPVLVLGGKADAASTAERAARAAAALNALVEQAAQKPVALEVRDKPSLGIGVSGSPNLLVEVTSEDLAAYEAVDPTLRSRRVPLRSIASYWAALIQDQIALFVRRERPMRLLELSTRARALSLIYSEALRRAGVGGGVPLGVVSPLSSTRERELREMALILPSEGQSVAAAAVEGRWEGTLWEEGQGDKAIIVKLRLVGARLVGALTRRTGGISVDLPLQDVAYEKGTLRFTVVVGGVKQRFEGAVKGEEVSGSIVPAAGGPSVGRFSLKYAG